MNPGIDYYMTSGLPATGTITFTRAPNTQPPSSATLTVTIGTTVYTWTAPGVTPQQDFCGTSANQLAISLCAAINAQQNRTDITTNNKPIKTHYAMYFNNAVTVISTVPGLAGNSLALSFASTDAGCATVSGTTLAGGSFQFPTLGRGQIVCPPPGGGGGGVAQVTAVSTPFQNAYFYGVKSWARSNVNQNIATANAATVFVGELIGGQIYFSDPVAATLIPTIISAPSNTQLDLSNFWFQTANATDAMFVKYL